MTDTELSDFVNDMGRKWHDHLQATTGDPFVERRELPAVDLTSMQLLRRLGRDRT
jgi:hypothetical protein